MAYAEAGPAPESGRITAFTVIRDTYELLDPKGIKPEIGDVLIKVVTSSAPGPDQADVQNPTILALTELGRLTKPREPESFNLREFCVKIRHEVSGHWPFSHHNRVPFVR